MKTKPIIPAVISALLIGLGGQLGAQQSDQHPSRTLNASGTNAAAQATSEKPQSELKVSEQEAEQQVQDINKASKLIGMKVRNKDNQDLGQIKDLVVDFKSGKVAYAVLVHGATLGFGGKMVAVPFNALTVQPGDKALLLNLSKDQVAQAPGFDEKNWPDLNAGASDRTIGLAASTPEQSTAGASAQGGSETPSGQTSGSSSSLDASSTNPVSAAHSDSNHIHDSAKGSDSDNKSNEEQQR